MYIQQNKNQISIGHNGYSGFSGSKEPQQSDKSYLTFQAENLLKAASINSPDGVIRTGVALIFRPYVSIASSAFSKKPKNASNGRRK